MKCNEKDKEHIISGIVAGIENSCWDLAEFIECAKSRKEADKIYDKIAFIELGIEGTIWDDFVDWDKVKWEDKDA